MTRRPLDIFEKSTNNFAQGLAAEPPRVIHASASQSVEAMPYRSMVSQDKQSFESINSVMVAGKKSDNIKSVYYDMHNGKAAGGL